jgi:isopentenyl-diphosphate delta-isomerase
MQKTDHSERKKQHLEGCLRLARQQPPRELFFDHRLLPKAFPDLALGEVDPSTTFLGKRLTFSFMIGAMTGGFELGDDLNVQLARHARRAGVALALGSLRPFLTGAPMAPLLGLRRELGSELPLLGNISVWQLADPKVTAGLAELAVVASLDALMVHVNPIQELAQPEGQRNFRRVFEALERFVAGSTVPVFVKGTGEGFDDDAIQRLCTLPGLAGVETGGRGTCDFAAVERLRCENPVEALVAQSLEGLGRSAEGTFFAFKNLLPEEATLVFGGGVGGPRDMVKALALGAHLVSAASAPLLALTDGTLEIWLASMRESLSRHMLLLGCPNLERLRQGWAIEQRTLP